MGCEHGICTNSWEWQEHFCTVCNECFETCGHEPLEHLHDYDEDGICKVCGMSSDGKPYIIQQPEDVVCYVTDMNSDTRGENKVTFRVRAKGEDLTYMWFVRINGQTVKILSDEDSSGYDDCILYEGAKTNTLNVWVKPDACSKNSYEFGCGVVNSKGKVESEMAKLDALHFYTGYEAVTETDAKFLHIGTKMQTAEKRLHIILPPDISKNV